jgi:VCBS repeat-containing protein
MSVDGNGGYAFTVNQTTRDNLPIGETLTQEFKYTITDKDGDKSTNTVTVKINGIAPVIADTPIASIDVTKVVSSTSDIIVKLGDSTYNIRELLANKNDSTQFKQKSNVGNNYDMDNDNTTKITVNGGLNQNDMVGGTLNNDIIIINGDVQSGTNINSTDGNDIVAILGNIYGGSFAGDNGTDYLYLGKPMSKYEILNYNGYEQGHPDMDFQLKDKDTGGILVVNNIEGIIFADGNTFGKVNIVKDTTVEYTVDLSAALTDTDGSETLTAIITGVPAGATFDSQFVINDNGVWKIVIPENATSINYTDVKMTVPLSVGAFTLKIEATATEKSNNHSASAYDSDAIVYAINETNTLTFGKATTNLLFTLDVSGSMNDKVLNSSGKYTTRFEIAKESMIETIKAYKVNGITEVNLTLFNSGAKNIGWKTADDAIDYLSKLTMNKDGYILYEGQFISGLTSKSTDYYDALNATMSVNFTGHKADNTVAYFLSDGEPRDNTSATNDDGDDIIKAWKDYVKENIQTLNVIGVGSGAKADPLKIIQVQEGDKVIMATTDATLGDTLLGTITASISGSVADNIFGGDGIKTIDSIIVDGREYTKTTFPTDGVALDGDGKLVFNFDTGAYTYTGKSSEFTSDTTKTFKVNVSDEDGDKASLDVNIKINVNDSQYLENKAPIAYITNDGSPLLGMIDVNVANLIKLQSNQMFAVYDQDDNIKSVKISSGGLLSSLLGPITGKLVFNFDSSVNVEGFKINGIGTDSLTIVANDADGATTAQFNTLLSKIKMDYSGLLDSLLGTNVDVFGKLSIVVEDTEGLKDSKTSANLIDLELLVSNNNTEENVNLMEEDIDLTQYVTKDTNIVSFENSKLDKITIELKDILIQEDKELIVKGDKGDIVQLDTPSDWSNVGKEQLDGVNYKVYTGTGVNSTIKLLIDDDIDVTPNI